MAGVTIDSLIDGLGGTKAVADDLCLKESTVSTWRARGFVPAKRWPEMVRVAAEQGRAEITFEVLAAMARDAAEVACR